MSAFVEAEHRNFQNELAGIQNSDVQFHSMRGNVDLLCEPPRSVDNTANSQDFDAITKEEMQEFSAHCNHLLNDTGVLHFLRLAGLEQLVSTST